MLCHNNHQLQIPLLIEGSVINHHQLNLKSIKSILHFIFSHNNQAQDSNLSQPLPTTNNDYVSYRSNIKLLLNNPNINISILINRFIEILKYKSKATNPMLMDQSIAKLQYQISTILFSILCLTSTPILNEFQHQTITLLLHDLLLNSSNVQNAFWHTMSHFRCHDIPLNENILQFVLLFVQSQPVLLFSNGSGGF